MASSVRGPRGEGLGGVAGLGEESFGELLFVRRVHEKFGLHARRAALGPRSGWFLALLCACHTTCPAM